MAAFQTVWSVDVGKSSLKAVKMHRERNSIEIQAVDKVDYPVEAGGIESLQAPKDALRTFAGRNEMNCPVIVSHPGHSAFSRFIQLPPVDAKKLEEMIGYEAQQQIPFPIDEVIWDYHVCESEEGSVEKEVGIFAVRKEVISDFILDFEQNGISPDHISVGYIGLLNYILFDLRPTKPAVVIDIGSDHTDLLIVDGGRFWVRNLGIAGNDVTQTIQEKFKLQFDEAEKIKRSATTNKEQAAKVYQVVQPILKEFVNEIHRSVGFYKSQAGDVKFEDVFLFGNGAKLIGVQRFLQEHLRFKVHVEKGFHRLRVNREANVALLQQDFPAFATVVGQGIQGLSDGVIDVNLLPQERQEEINFKSKQKIVIAAAASLYIVIAFLYWNLGGKISDAEEAISSAKIATDLGKNEKAIKALDKREAEIGAAAAELALISHNRQQPALAIEAISAVMGELPNAAAAIGNVEITADDDAPLDLSGLETEQRDLNDKKAWLLQFTTQRVLLDAAGKEVPIKAKLVVDPAQHRWAHKMMLIGAISNQGDGNDNTAFLRSQVIEPLQVELRRCASQADLVVKPAVAPVQSPMENLWVKHDQLREGGRGTSDSEKVQGEYHPFALTWLQHARPLPSNSDEDEQPK